MTRIVILGAGYGGVTCAHWTVPGICGVPHDAESVTRALAVSGDLRGLRRRRWVDDSASSWRLQGAVAQRLDAFRSWMAHHRGLRASTLDVYCRIVGGLLVALGVDGTRY